MKEKKAYEIIDNMKRRKEFSYFKYRTVNQSPQNQTLTKVLSSMPLERLEEVYEKKKLFFKHLVQKKKVPALPKITFSRDTTFSQTISSQQSSDQEVETTYRISRQEEVDNYLNQRPVTKSPQRLKIVTEKEKKEKFHINDKMKLYFEGKIPYYKDQIMLENHKSFFNSKNYYNVHYSNINAGIQINPENKKKEANYIRKLEKLIYSDKQDDDIFNK